MCLINMACLTCDISYVFSFYFLADDGFYAAALGPPGGNFPISKHKHY